MIITYKYRIYPTNSQKTKIKELMSLHANLYNKALEEKEAQYKEAQKSDSCFDQIKNLIPNFKKEDGKNCNYSALQQVVRRLHKNYNAIYNKRGGKPRFRKELSLEYSSHGDGWKLKNDILRVQYIGELKINLHRPFKGIPKNLVITRNREKFYISISSESSPHAPTPSINRFIGIDFGLKTFLTTSEGKKIEHPQPLKESSKKIARVSRQIKKSRDGNLKIKLNKKLKIRKKLYCQIANRRKDFAHKLSRKIVNSYSFIAVEDLNLKNLTTEISNINKKYSDVAVGMFYGYLSYKAERAGRQFIKINPAYTSRTCSKCGVISKDEMTLRQRVFKCECGHEEDRDINAAKNILNKALKTVGLYSLEKS